MTESTAQRNDFLLDLLALQQDGKYSISAPTNWTTHTPLLEVATEVDATIAEMEDSILLRSGQNSVARWHFFIGSPGNGKSAAIGKLCRRLISAKGCDVRDESGVTVSQLERTAIPYALDVYEGDNKFASAQMVQDASVVRNPFSTDVDPATELMDTIQLAWRKGISLIVCTNRGVLEKAYGDNHTNRDVNTEPWFKVMAAVVSASTSSEGFIEGERAFNGRKTVFETVKVGYSHLDNRSLLLNRRTFENLVQKATNGANWEKCDSCSLRVLCPFATNRDWLADSEGRKQVLQLLTRAEVLSGQVIVFREALAIISLLLAGCPRDYGSSHPCEWVQQKATRNDLFALACRRVYMALFASYCPYGLEPVELLRDRQWEALTNLREVVAASDATRDALACIITCDAPSSDVGVTRLLGGGGILSSLDPSREALPVEFYDRWDSDFEVVLRIDDVLLTEIERRCLTVWKELETNLELEADHSVSAAHWALRRWSSNYLLHFAALREGRSAWAEELDQFAELLSFVAIPPEQRSLEQKRTLRQLDTRLESLLNAVAGDQTTGAITLSEAVTLHGAWVSEKLKPRVVSSDSSGSVSLAVEFTGGERAIFAAPMYLWLTLLASGRLDSRCLPEELLAGVQDARVRAAARGRYAFEDNDVELLISTGDGEQIKLIRLDGDVDVSA